MGNEESTVVDESTHPSVLEARNIQAVAKYIKKHDVKRIVVMVCTRDPEDESMANWHRWEQASVRRRAFLISGHQIPVSMPI